MKVAILGANGFVGRNISLDMSRDHEVHEITRDVLNLLDSSAVRSHFMREKYDVVINAAVSYTSEHLLDDSRNNLGLFMNIHACRGLFGKFINLGSGAEFDRNRNIDQANESEIFDAMPSDSYGFGLNVKSRICFFTDKFYTIRIFNCFGAGEASTRLFARYLNSDGLIEITNDRYFDYISIQDLCVVIRDCAENSWCIKDVNAVYQEKIRISEALDRFCEVNNLPKTFFISSRSQLNYTGNGYFLSCLNLSLTGLDEGFKSYIKCLKETKVS
jgi:nucleoside-diphosphate-sugar epimerase